jgi:hypothetical protein
MFRFLLTGEDKETENYQIKRENVTSLEKPKPKQKKNHFTH